MRSRFARRATHVAALVEAKVRGNLLDVAIELGRDALIERREFKPGLLAGLQLIDILRGDTCFNSQLVRNRHDESC